MISFLNFFVNTSYAWSQVPFRVDYLIIQMTVKYILPLYTDFYEIQMTLRRSELLAIKCDKNNIYKEHDEGRSVAVFEGTQFRRDLTDQGVKRIIGLHLLSRLISHRHFIQRRYSFTVHCLIIYWREQLALQVA